MVYVHFLEKWRHFFSSKHYCAVRLARNFDWGGLKLENLWDVILVTILRHWNDVITNFLKFDLVIISLKNHNLAKSRNFRSPILKIKQLWERKSRLVKFVTKIMHFSHISAKIQHKNQKQHVDWGGRGAEQAIWTPLWLRPCFRASVSVRAEVMELCFWSNVFSSKWIVELK